MVAPREMDLVKNRLDKRNILRIPDHIKLSISSLHKLIYQVIVNDNIELLFTISILTV